MIHTTINLRSDRYALIIKSSVYSGKSTNILVTHCLKKLLPKLKRDFYRFSTMRYQPPAADWEHLPFSANSRDFERFLSYKVRFKLSFSFLVAIALDLFLNEVIEETTNPNPENHSHSYNSYLFFVDIFIYKNEFLIIYHEKEGKKLIENTS